MTARDTTTSPREKWRAAGAGRRYAEERWGGSRRAGTDPRLVAELAARHGALAGRTLDVGCGVGRLRPALEGAGAQWVGVDASLAMLAEARERGAERCLAAEAEALPFRDGAFDLAVACRLLHHFHDDAGVVRVLGELLRVAPLAVVSFWDAASWPALRRRLGLARDEGPAGRVARSRAELVALAERAGAEVVELRAVARFVSQQTFAVLRRAREGA